GIPYQRCGKVIVATAEEELPRLDRLYERGVANRVPGLERVGPERLREIEPSVPALRGIYSPGTGIVDYRLVAATMAKVLEGRGAAVLTGARVAKIARADGRLVLETPRGAISAGRLINCAGLYADRVARLAGVRTGLQIIPFRGEYYHLRPERRHLVRSLIYPVPDPAFPFLGVHFTRTIQGTVEAGPNAVLAFAREGYSYRQIRIRELAEFLAYPGFWRMAARYWRMGLYEMYRSLHKAAFLRALQRLLPAITAADLLPGGAGVRAQAVERDGSLVDDFRIVETPHGIHVLNAPSPAATASLAIGRHIAGLAARTVTSRTS
ncbi:MAG: L-2-hydroxyglutarate oxidase, partial [Candidatus Methylomirabilales bacterium]